MKYLIYPKPPQAEPQAVGFSSGLSSAPQAEPQAAGFSSGLSEAPQAVPQAAATSFSFQPVKFESAIFFIPPFCILEHFLFLDYIVRYALH